MDCTYCGCTLLPSVFPGHGSLHSLPFFTADSLLRVMHRHELTQIQIWPRTLLSPWIWDLRRCYRQLRLAGGGAAWVGRAVGEGQAAPPPEALGCDSQFLQGAKGPDRCAP